MSSDRRRFNSAIASRADRFVSPAAVASDWLRQRRSDSGAIPRSLATCSTTFVSDEYDDSGVYLVPFAVVPSSPIELGEMRNKNQFISKCGLVIALTHSDMYFSVWKLIKVLAESS